MQLNSHPARRAFRAAHPFRLNTCAWLTLALVLASTGCSTLDGDKIDYKSAGKGPLLEVPPDLTALSRDARYVVPGSAVTASGYSTSPATQNLPVAASALGDVRIERAGNQRWLVVSRSPEQLWGPVRDFWLETGFLFNVDQQALGILETDWAENRAKLPQDFIRNTVGKAFDGLYSTGERDKFRTRLERAGNTTEIYISHRGLIEKLAGSPSGANTLSTIWEPRSTDPELETEFLRRLMLKLGASQEQTKTIVAAVATDKVAARVATQNGVPAVMLDDGFDRAWRRVGLTLDRTGFTVEDRDRAKGIYFVRYVEPNDKKEAGFFSKLFGGGKEGAPLKFRIAVRSTGESTAVTVLSESGSNETSGNAQRIVKLLADDLK